MKSNAKATESPLTIVEPEFEPGAADDTEGAESRKMISAWNDHHEKKQATPKAVVAQYVATHLVQFGQVIQMASGTTLTAVMNKLIERQTITKKPLELIIMTTNLDIANLAREASLVHPAIFATQQVLLTGGELHPSLLSLVGPLAAQGVMTAAINPSIVILGAAAVSFQADYGALIYHYGNELGTQIAYANRPTKHRIIIFDCEKLNIESGFKSTSFDQTLKTADEVSLICNFPDTGTREEIDRVRAEIEKFEEMLDRMKHDKSGILANKTFRLRLIDSSGNVHTEISNRPDR